MVRHRFEIVGRAANEPDSSTSEQRIATASTIQGSEKTLQPAVQPLAAVASACENGVCALDWKPQRPVA